MKRIRLLDCTLRDGAMSTTGASGAGRADSVLVGDTVHDALGAARAGLPFIALTYGFGFKTPEGVREHPHIGVAGAPMEIADIVSGGRA